MSQLTELEWDLILMPKTLLYCCLSLSFPNSQRIEKMLKLVSVLPIPSLLPHFWKDVSLVILASQRLFLPPCCSVDTTRIAQHGIDILTEQETWGVQKKKNSSRIFISLYLILKNKTSPSNLLASRLLDNSQYLVMKSRLHESQMMFSYSPVELFCSTVFLRYGLWEIKMFIV